MDAQTSCWDAGATSTDPNNPFSEPSTFIDPLTDGSACQRDITYLRQLTVNAVRIYSVNSSLNHDACMQTLSDAGIYTMCVVFAPIDEWPAHQPLASTSHCP